LITSYFSHIRNINGVGDISRPWDLVKGQSDYACLLPLIEHVFCAPCTSAPVERVFNHGGLLGRTDSGATTGGTRPPNFLGTEFVPPNFDESIFEKKLIFMQGTGNYCLFKCRTQFKVIIHKLIKVSCKLTEFRQFV